LFYPNIGGVETHVGMISQKLVQMNVYVEVLTTDPTRRLPASETINGIKVRRFPSWAPNNTYFFSHRLWTFLKDNSQKYDIVHAHSYHAFPSLFAALSKRNNKLVFTPHYHGAGRNLLTTSLHVPYKLIGSKVFTNADVIISVSDYERRLISVNFGIPREKIVVIGNGVTLSDFGPLEKIEKSSDSLLCVARLEKNKRIDRLVEALQYLDSKIHLDIVGSGPDKKRLLKLIHDLRLNDRVQFLQDLPRSRLLEEYKRAGAFVLLSRYEAFGISVAEALAAGTPCVVATASALAEWVDGNNCLGVSDSDGPAKIAEVIRLAIGRRVSYPKLRDWDDVTQDLLSVYEHLLK